MGTFRPISVQPAIVLISFAGFAPLTAQQSVSERFFAHNAEMTRLQPAFVTPLATSDPRIIQYARIAVSSEYTPAHTQTVSYGNNRGAGIVAFQRFEFDWVPPSYIQHNSRAVNNGTIDGFGDTALAAKVRIASGNAEHGNFEISALLNHCFPTGSHTNGAATGTYTPTLAFGYAFLRRWDAISTLGGTLPTGMIAKQGRTIAWNSLAQFHATRLFWFELENNSTFYFAGRHDGRMQNFLTPGAIFVARRKEWKPTHPFAIFGAGMQIATSGFHTYNHNTIAETRIIF